MISPAAGEGYSLDTVFDIRLVDFKDEDFPLKYRFYYYSSEELYQTERELGASPVSSRRDFLVDNGFRN